jgi:hypothetical protein
MTALGNPDMIHAYPKIGVRSILNRRLRNAWGLVFTVSLLGLVLQIACSQSNGERSNVAASSPISQTAYTKNLQFDLSNYASVLNANLTISNQGADPVMLPAVFAQGDSAPNLLSILGKIRASGPLTGEQFAMATWQYASQNIFHYCYAGAPGDPSDFATEPMRLMHGFGFTCCDQSSRILNWLWQEGGYPSRIATMSFHVVPEIYYANAWHLYDADHRVYYMAQDNKTVASVAEVISDPTLVARTANAQGNDPAGFPAQEMANLYAIATPTYSTVNFGPLATYTLQPSQSFTFKSENSTTSIFHGGSDPIPSNNVSSGQMDWALDFSASNWSQLANSSSGVTTISSGGSVFLTNSSGTPGQVIYSVSSPFPVFNLKVSGMVYLGDKDSVVNAYFSTDGSKWSGAFAMNGEVGNTTQATVDLTSAASGQYSYFVKLELSGTAANAARIAQVHLTSQNQVSVIVFPKLIPKAVNHLVYQDWSPATQQHNVSVSVKVVE